MDHREEVARLPPSVTDPYVQYYCIRFLQLVRHEIADLDMVKYSRIW